MRVLVFMVLAAGASVNSEVPTELPDGYIVNSIAGKAYKVMYQAQDWDRARVECEKTGGFLAVPKSQDEFDFLQKLVRGMYYPQVTGTRYKLLVWLGIHNLDDYTVWRNIHGEDINETGFNKWVNNHVGYSADPQEPHCAGMDAVNPGLRDYWCHLRQPYICQVQVTTHGTPYYNNVNENVDNVLHVIGVIQENLACHPAVAHYMAKKPRTIAVVKAFTFSKRQHISSEENNIKRSPKT